jgi:hypothetical protein
MEVISALIDMNVGVTEGTTAVGGSSVEVDVRGIDVCAAVGGEEVGVIITSTEKLQASSNSALNTKTMISSDHVRCFMTFSL